MSTNENEILSGLNQIFTFLGPYGGKITIDSDWDFYCKVYNFNGFIETAIFSRDGRDNCNYVDPFFQIELYFDEEGKTITRANPVEYLSQWPGGELHMDLNDNSCVYKGDCDSMEEDIKERLVSYLATITGVRPYLTSPVSVERYQEYATY
jgi:hypothetical protein